MKIALKKILNKITPLPWKFTPESVVHNTLDAAYALHASNVLPEVVAILRQMKVLADSNGRLVHDSLLADAVRSTLARAEEVNVPDR